ncbi:hypothetical protein STEG23_032733 [Scotinomys teguina]
MTTSSSMAAFCDTRQGRNPNNQEGQDVLFKAGIPLFQGLLYQHINNKINKLDKTSWKTLAKAMTHAGLRFQEEESYLRILLVVGNLDCADTLKPIVRIESNRLCSEFSPVPDGKPEVQRHPPAPLQVMSPPTEGRSCKPRPVGSQTLLSLTYRSAVHGAREAIRRNSTSIRRLQIDRSYNIVKTPLIIEQSINNNDDLMPVGGPWQSEDITVRVAVSGEAKSVEKKKHPREEMGIVKTVPTPRKPEGLRGDEVCSIGKCSGTLAGVPMAAGLASYILTGQEEGSPPVPPVGQLIEQTANSDEKEEGNLKYYPTALPTPNPSPNSMLAGPEGAQAGPDGAQTGPDGTQAGPEGTEAGPEGAEAGPDGAQVGPEGSEAGPEGAQAGPDGAQAGPEGTQAGPEGAQAGPEGAQVGPELAAIPLL